MIRVIALTDAGLTLANKLAVALPNSTVHFKPKPFAETVQGFFQAGDGLVCICATGIVVRTLAPVLVHKLSDPPVLVLDELGRFVIPLLSGHEGGANQLASEISKRLGAQRVMTTANAYLDPIYTVGMGCERHCPLSYLETLFLSGLELAGLAIEDVKGIYSIDLKADETYLLALANKYGLPFLTYSVEQLKEVEALLSTRSDYVFQTVGLYGVAESAALFSAQQLTGNPSELCLPKIKNAKATCAIARAYVEY